MAHACSRSSKRYLWRKGVSLLAPGVGAERSPPGVGYRYHVYADAAGIQVPGGQSMDWYSRFVLSWELSNTLDVGFGLVALAGALALGKPHIFNSDQGVQLTSQAFTGRLEEARVAISMDGAGEGV